MQGTLGTVHIALASPAGPVTLIGQPSVSQIPDAAVDPGPGLAWQSSIGQFIFLQSLEHERI